MNGYDPRRRAWSDEAMGRFFPEVLLQIGQAGARIEAATGRLSPLDTDCGVDAVVRTNHRSYSWALRLRGRSYHRFRDISIRYQSLQTPGKGLEANKTIAQLMLYGWADTECKEPFAPPSRMLEWHVLSLPATLDAWQTGALRAQERTNSDPSSTSLYFDLHDLYRLDLIRHSSAGGYRPEPEPPPLLSPPPVEADGDPRIGVADRARRALDAEIADYRQGRLF